MGSTAGAGVKDVDRGAGGGGCGVAAFVSSEVLDTLGGGGEDVGARRFGVG